MSLTEKIKNLFRKEDMKNEPKAIPVDTKFQSNRFKNIKIYAPDLDMVHENWKDYTVQILDGDNNPIANEKVKFEISGTTYFYDTDVYA